MKDTPFVSWAPTAFAAVPLERPASDSGEPPSHTEWRLERPSNEASPSVPPTAPEPAMAPELTPDATDAPSAECAYQLWRDRVWRFTSRLGVPTEALEDATQDVFAAVCRRWADFSGLSTRRTWVLGFVPKIASQYRRRHARRREQGNDDLVNESASGRLEHDPFESTARREARIVVQAFLESLRDPDRQLFVLVDLEGESVVEAAAVLELKIRHAYKSLERSRREFEARVVRHRAGDEWRLR